MIPLRENSRKDKTPIREGKSMRVWIGGGESLAKESKETSLIVVCKLVQSYHHSSNRTLKMGEFYGMQIIP